MSRLFLNKSYNRSGKKANNVTANNNTIYGEESPLQDRNRMNNTVCGAPFKSPCTKFARHNSNPFPGPVTCAAPVQETPKKIDDSKQQKSLGKFLKFIRPNTRKKKIPPVVAGVQTDENSSSILSDELITPSKASPQQQRFMSQMYETSVNKHGDVVEYAVPYSEFQPPIIVDSESSRCEGVTDENALNESKWSDGLVDIGALGIVSPMVKTTDLDKSSDGYRSLLDQSGRRMIDSNNRDVLSELDSLERWSQNIPLRSLPAHEPPIETNVHVIRCKPKELKPKRSALRNTIALPLHFASGYFRKTPVAVRKCCPRDSISIGLVEEAIERDYDILNKVKHPNIVLLMAASFHRKSFDHMTLVLEPVDYTLNYFLHQMDTTLSTVDSISIVQQIASAALYLQECGYIHSNISSHNILVRESPWCVKLSSFELTTEVDYQDTRIELLVEYRGLRTEPLNKNCADTPKYATVDDESASLRDQYRRMSKLLPMLKCSPHTQHKYLSMMSKHLIYDINYRQHLSLHNLQAPELLTTNRQFVFPTTKADVYSLCLLLWEMLNSCVPFVVYSRLDMERMIQSNKLRMPFFERERCEPFMDIFKIGLALSPDDRTIDLQQLIEALEDVKFRIRSGVRDLDKEQLAQRVPQRNLYVNTAREACPKSESSATNSIFSPDSTDFSDRLHGNELTSTTKKKRKSPQKLPKKNAFRQLFSHSKEAASSGECESILTHAQLNENLDAIAHEIRREQSLDDIAEGSERSRPSSSSEENEFPSKLSVEKPLGRDAISSGNAEWRKTSPDEVVDFEVGDEKQSTNSKSCDNVFDASTSEPRCRSFHSNIASPPTFNVGEYSLPDTPIARKNKIRRNAWLSNKSLNLSNKEIDELAMDQSQRLNDSNQMNVSIRIVHSKVTPKKVDSENSLVTSRIKFFDANTETSNNVPLSTSSTKASNNEIASDIDPNYSANYPIKASTSKELLELAHDHGRSDSGGRDAVAHYTRNSLPVTSQHPLTSRGGTERQRTLSNCSTLPMSRKECSDSRNPSSNIDPRSSSFDINFWKREWDICNRSQGSDDTDEDGNVITPKWRSVRDKILKFENRGIVTTASSPLKTATEFVRNLSRSVTANPSTGIQSPEASTLIKRTVYSESIVSGVDLASLDRQMPLFDQLNLGGSKLTTQVTLNMRQIRRRSSDLDEVDRPKIIEGIAGIRHTICGSQKGLLSINADGSSGGKAKYICTDCTTKMSPDELRALTFESVAESPIHTKTVTDYPLPSPVTNRQRTPQRRCQVRVKSQDTRSIEDLYIDDDFDQGLGLGANIELQSDSSDFLNFDILSDIFNKSKVDT